LTALQEDFTACGEKCERRKDRVNKDGDIDQ